MIIENVSTRDVRNGFHYYNEDEDCVLIQIGDQDDGYFPNSKREFNHKYRFEFFDTDIDDTKSFTREQAKEIINILRKAKEENMNVIVHCAAGIRRSGAVAQIGEIMGFKNLGRTNSPNLRVKKFLMDELNLSY